MYRQGILRREEYILTWSSIATTATNVAPDTDTEIDCRNAKAIVIQVDLSSTTYPGNDTDINVITRPEGGTYDNVPFAEANFGSGEVRSFLVSPGPGYIKLRADNNDTSNKTAPKVVVQVLA